MSAHNSPRFNSIASNGMPEFEHPGSAAKPRHRCGLRGGGRARSWANYSLDRAQAHVRTEVIAASIAGCPRRPVAP